jgi:uncharacterized protein YerC
MKILALKYNLYLVDFSQIELDIQKQFKIELDRYGFTTYEELPKKDYTRLLRYFTLSTLCKAYNTLPNKKNTIFFVNQELISVNILSFLKDVKKVFPFLLYFTSEAYRDISNPYESALNTEITIKLIELRYSTDHSKFSFNKIKRFCKENELENLISDFKL